VRRKKNVLENREITFILNGEMSFATETSLGLLGDFSEPDRLLAENY